MTHVTCRVTAKNRDQLRNPTLGNRVWASFLLLRRKRKWEWKGEGKGLRGGKEKERGKERGNGGGSA